MWSETISKAHGSTENQFSKSSLCKVFGYTRQGYRKHEQLRKKRSIQEAAVLGIVREIRAEQPRVGCRKMLDFINKELLLQGIEPIGRDRFFECLRERNMLVEPLKSKTYTTDSYHRFKVYKNLVKGTKVERPNQVFVSDITYLRLRGNTFCYLFLLTDLYSRKIVGYHLSMSLAVDGALKALRMALKQAQYIEDIIHHSDRGIQYCCDGYVQEMKKHTMQISMTEENHCYENAVAERVNGTLKYDFLLKEVLPSFKIAKNVVAQVIKIYNEKRWHESLGYLTPAMKHAA